MAAPGRSMKVGKPKNIKNTLKRLLSYLLIYKKVLIVVIALILFTTGVSVYGSTLLKAIIDKYLIPLSNGYDSLLLSKFVKTLFLLLTLYIVSALASYLSNRIMLKVSTETLYKLRVDMFNKMETLPISFYDSHTHGELMSRYTNDIDTLREMLSNSITTVFSSLLTIISVFIMMIVYSVPLTLIVIVMILVLTKIVKYIASISGKNFKKQQENVGIMNGYIEEIMSGQKVVKVFCHEDETIDKFNELNEKLFNSTYRAHMYANVLMPISNNISHIFYAIIAIVGGLFAINNLMTLGSLVTFLQFTRNFANPIAQISQQLNTMLAALAGAERIFEIMDQKSEVDNGKVRLVNVKKENRKLVEVKKNTGTYAWKVDNKLVLVEGKIEFNNVIFGYNSDKIVLKDISLYAKPGQKIAFVGSTGAGKTTITNLLNRFYDIKEGSILYDGIDIREINKKDLRKSLSMVLQDTHLFTGTIYDNIRYGRLNATDEEVIEAAKKANADSFIDNLPDGYNTVLNSDGANLSQGQRQLLSIARAAVANPIVLVLDEATSSIDTRTELLIENGMNKLMKNKTTFVIAHRLSTVKNANAIMVLENGKIIERGDHLDLLEQKGRYYELYTGMFELE